MANYIFNVYLHTDMVELKSEYFYNLPPFYFAQNEYVSTRANISTTSTLTARGATIFNLEARIEAESRQTCQVYKSIYYSAMITANMDTTGFVQGSSIKYTDITCWVWLNSYAIPDFTHT